MLIGIAPIVFIDLDKVVVDNQARYQTALAEIRRSDPAQLDDQDAFWRAFLDSQKVYLDRLIVGAETAVARIESLGCDILLLTSRPESMRDATVSWLAAHDIDEDVYSTLYMKPPAATFTQTATWKASLIQALIASILAYGVPAVWVIDDDPKNRAAVTANIPFLIRTASSLAEAVPLIEADLSAGH